METSGHSCEQMGSAKLRCVAARGGRCLTALPVAEVWRQRVPVVIRAAGGWPRQANGCWLWGSRLGVAYPLHTYSLAGHRATAIGNRSNARLTIPAASPRDLYRASTGCRQRLIMRRAHGCCLGPMCSLGVNGARTGSMQWVIAGRQRAASGTSGRRFGGTGGNMVVRRRR